MKAKGHVLALIPARGGSRRVKNKNMRLLAGKPLIAYTIEAALQSKLINRVIVSTDSSVIAEIAQAHGAEVPFLRPSRMARPDSTEYEFHLHALDWLRRHQDYEPSLIVNLYPTTPFRRSSTIDRAIRLMWRHPECDSLRSVRVCAEHPFKMWTANKQLLNPFVKTSHGMHTAAYHLLPRIYIQNASIYITKPEVIWKLGRTIGKKVLKFEMDEYESVDINTPLDFEFADFLLRSRNHGRQNTT
jgi:N-acylneuraminate cytidylyltransferase/CMP-N,N'-diacetyllegionaminic acid synthase